MVIWAKINLRANFNFLQAFFYVKYQMVAACSQNEYMLVKRSYCVNVDVLHS